MPEEDEDNASEAESIASNKGGDKFKIILRSSLGKDVSLTVRPTTTCGAIIRAFLKQLGLQDKYPGAGEVDAAPAAKKGKGRYNGSPK